MLSKDETARLLRAATDLSRDSSDEHEKQLKQKEEELKKERQEKEEKLQKELKAIEQDRQVNLAEMYFILLQMFSVEVFVLLSNCYILYT